MKKYALMLFYTAGELAEETLPSNAYLLKDIHYFDNGIEALNEYANTKCPASQLIEGNTKEELEENILKMIINYSDNEWINKNLFHYL